MDPPPERPFFPFSLSPKLLRMNFFPYSPHDCVREGPSSTSEGSRMFDIFSFPVLPSRLLASFTLYPPHASPFVPSARLYPRSSVEIPPLALCVLPFDFPFLPHQSGISAKSLAIAISSIRSGANGPDCNLPPPPFPPPNSFPFTIPTSIKFIITLVSLPCHDNFLSSLSQSFGRFFHECPFLDDSPLLSH